MKKYFVMKKTAFWSLILIGALVCVGTVSADPSLVLHLEAENNFNDSSDLGNHGIPHGVTFERTMWGDYAFKFDGNSFIEIPDQNNGLDLLGDFTVEFLLRPTDDKDMSHYEKGWGIKNLCIRVAY
jgi:hypothetical protein